MVTLATFKGFTDKKVHSHFVKSVVMQLTDRSLPNQTVFVDKHEKIHMTNMNMSNINLGNFFNLMHNSQSHKFKLK